MKTLTAALQSAHSDPVQKPAWLVQVSFSTPLRVSSYDTVTYGGNSYDASDVDVSRVRVGGVDVDGSLILGNADDTVAALVLNEGISGRAIRIWGFDGAAVSSDDDFVLLVDAVAGRAVISGEKVTIELKESTAYAFTPRQYVAPPAFTYLMPAGAKIKINGETYTIERR